MGYETGTDFAGGVTNNLFYKQSHPKSKHDSVQFGLILMFNGVSTHYG